MPTIEVFETSRRTTAGSTTTPSARYARQQFEASLHWLKSRGVQIERHAIPLTGPLVIDNTTVKTAIELQGEDALPIVVLDGTIISIGGFPTRSETLVSAGYKASDDPGFLEEASTVAANIAAALAGNNTTTLLSNCEQALSLGLAVEDVRSIVASAKTVRGETIRDETLTAVEQFLAFGPAGKPKSPCCG